MLHCIKQHKGEGAESQFVDGFHVAHQLKEKYPDSFKVLTETPVDFVDNGEDMSYWPVCKMMRVPMFM